MEIAGLFIAAIYGRFGRRGGWVIYGVSLGVYFLGNLVLRRIERAPDSLLARLVHAVTEPLAGLPVPVLVLLAGLAGLARLVYALHQLLRQPVQF